MPATPTTTKIMVIRHAEKPPDSGAPLGVTPEGAPDKESLIVPGWQRAGALACFFAPTHGPLQRKELAIPQHLFASASKSGSGSQRPLQTITPLASKLGLTPKTHKKSDTDKVAGDARTCGGTALVCWQHEDIPTIANAILGNRTTVPQKWPEDRFDLVWVFDLEPSSKSYGFTQVPQCLLKGDSPDVISGP
jgi:hypothetical protein